MKKVLFLFLVIWLISSCNTVKLPVSPPQEFSTGIRLNQIGYYPDAPKKAVIAADVSDTGFHVIDLQTMKSVFSGKLSPAVDWKLAGETVRIADFSKLKKPGRYSVFLKEAGYSYPFKIAPNIYADALKASMKSFYLHRAGMPIEQKYAGKWQRPAGHPDNPVIFHPSSGREGTTSSPKGWYDAGDYGKYVVNGAFALGQMLYLYEQYPGVLTDGALNIPESGNGVSDLLDEFRYEMDWLLTMQDDDGGAFVKLTTARFDGMVMPHKLNQPRYIIGKSTAATLDFAGVAAKMSRAFAKTNPAYAKTCLDAAIKAWKWAVQNPDTPFRNPEDIKTGEYGDQDFCGEFFWAAAELYAATRSNEYLPYLEKNIADFRFRENENWANFLHHFGAFTLLESARELPITSTVSKSILASADELVLQTAKNDYLQAVDNFFWGSNSDVLGAAMILAHAYRISRKPQYLVTIKENVDYIFGKNATGHCFLTGFGSKSPMFVHHRLSAADGITEPLPGFLSGGPNFGKQDAANVKYLENAPPMKCWVDEQASFASNEIAINWNSALVYVLGFLEAEAK